MSVHGRDRNTTEHPEAGINGTHVWLKIRVGVSPGTEIDQVCARVG